MKTKYGKWVRLEDNFDCQQWLIVDRLHDYILGYITYNARQRKWLLRTRKKLDSLEPKVCAEIRTFVNQLNAGGPPN